MSENLLTLTIDGHEVKASADSSIIQAYARSGNAITANVGCMGQGVCGSCRCMIRKEGEREVTTALACETKVEEGMQVSFLDYFIPEHIQYYDVGEIGDGWNWLDDTAKAFPEAQNCRHCGGCNRACPKGLQVENGVAQVVSGDFGAAGADLRPMRDVQPLHPLLPRTHPSEPLGSVRSPYESGAYVAPCGFDAPPTRNRQRQNESRI